MLNLAFLFFTIAIITAVMTLSGAVSTAVGIPQIVFLLFVVLFALSLILGRRDLHR